jgi:hypothetical protein
MFYLVSWVDTHPPKHNIDFFGDRASRPWAKVLGHYSGSVTRNWHAGQPAAKVPWDHSGSVIRNIFAGGTDQGTLYRNRGF